MLSLLTLCVYIFVPITSQFYIVLTFNGIVKTSVCHRLFAIVSVSWQEIYCRIKTNEICDSAWVFLEVLSWYKRVESLSLSFLTFNAFDLNECDETI